MISVTIIESSKDSIQGSSIVTPISITTNLRSSSYSNDGNNQHLHIVLYFEVPINYII